MFTIISFKIHTHICCLATVIGIITINMSKVSGENAGLSPNDPNSYSRPDLAIVRSLHLSLDIDFVRHVLTGKVNLNVEKVNKDANELILDVKNLNISSVINLTSETPMKYEISGNTPEIGLKLSISLPENISKEFTVVIYYETSPQADALQWLLPIQTSGKKHPFMFSQGQPIEIRSIIPCQDTPSVKTPYTAEITAPSELTVLMSAQIYAEPTNLQNGTRLHQFKQKVPTPSYLIAIAVGKLESRVLGPRSKVWAEKELVDQAQYEFHETEQMLQIAEDICGPYVWGNYDILVLPPSFAYGGMENPCLTFVTPTLLAGDRSLANVIAHEISHSWTGNLVTNANFEHFWLNEGFTTFVERKIVGRIKDEKERDFAAVVGIVELRDTIKKLENGPFTKLVIDLKGIHPDEAFSKVPYEKGQLFLRYLEQLVGGTEIFEQFLKKYLDKYKYQSIVTNDFKNTFIEYFASNDNITKIDWDNWLFTPGMPPELPILDMTRADTCKALKNKWMNWNDSIPECPTFNINDIKSMSVDQICQFFNILNEEEPLPIYKLQAMQDVYNLSIVKNAEIKCRWLRICLKSHWKDQVQPALNFVTEVGRMKFVFDIYKVLYEWEEVRPKAIENFNLTKDKMMYVTQKGIAKILHLNE